MKNISKLFVACIAIAAMSSCRSYTYTSRVENIRDAELKATTTLVDVNVDFTKRIVAESDRQKTEQQAKEEAKYNAIVDNKIDVLVDPIYKIERRPAKMKPFKAYLTGFAGYYTNPRTTTEDIKNLEDVNMEEIEKHIILENPTILPLLKQIEHSNNGNITVNNYGDGKSKVDNVPAKKDSKDTPNDAAPKEKSSKKK